MLNKSNRRNCRRREFQAIFDDDHKRKETMPMKMWPFQLEHGVDHVTPIHVQPWLRIDSLRGSMPLVRHY